MQKSGSQDRARLAAVGLGRWARVMAAAYRSSEVADLVACFSRNPERRRSFAEDFGCDEEESLDRLLARDDVDGIVATVPNDQHAPVIEAAVRAGKHVYVEKPIAVDPSDIRRISEAVTGSGVVFACGHSARRLAGLREMRRCLDTGEIGVPSSVEAVFSNERGLELKDGDWRGDPVQTPGGPLTQLGIHQIDNLHYLFGVPRRVSGMGMTKLSAARNTMVASALLEFDDVIGYLGANWLTPGTFTIDLYCSAARLRYDLDFGWWSRSAVSDEHSRLLKVEIGRAGQASADPDGRELLETTVSLAPRNHLREEIEEFAEAVKGRATVEVGLDVAMANVATMLAVARSIERGTTIEVAEVLGELG